ncbi:hypothetical protein DEU56DRAFT_817259 [Suillus clintonianus]|uniref:uncharacterized protein n=1 Tax=Suillus clintonianus TaxID=1904413 RepID=UPI001B8860A7|nr:uncharacterized protein DEU56DRAFT_817259 [Suillus clintonianus]KAG2129475.1 hypothetical protein DEU56DRAFT_817259 [Suillus clintonianus]
MEAKVYEILKQHPHPNICVFYRCVRDGDYVTSICLQKYGRMFMDVAMAGQWCRPSLPESDIYGLTQIGEFKKGTRS